MKTRVAVTSAVALVLAAGAFPGAAWGHAAFLTSNPAPGTKLESGPAEISLEFTEPLNRELSDASLIDAESGEEIPVALATGGQRRLLIRPQIRLGRAPYTVRWHTVSTLDGHPLEGAFGFGVRTAAESGEQDVEQSPLARDGWLRIAARALLYASLFFFAGGVLNAAVLARRARPESWLFPEALETAARRSGIDPRQRSERLWRRTEAAGALALVLAIGVALIESADAGGGLSADSVDAYLLSNGAGLARLGTVAAVGLAVLLASRATLVAAACLAAALLTIALSGHANSADPRALAVLTDWVHLIAGSIWIGGIAQVAGAWVPALARGSRELRLTVIGSVLGRFGQVALVAFVVVIATGSANALIQLGHPRELWESAYGRLLALKIGLVAVIAAASYAHALRIRPRLLAASPNPTEPLERRLWRLLGIEPWLGLGVIVAVAVLVAFPLPPRQLSEADEAEAAAPCTPSCPLPTAAPDELAVAGQAGPDIAAFWLRREGAELGGTMRLLNLDFKPVDASVELAEGVGDDCGTGCWRLTDIPAGPEVSVAVEVGDDRYRVAVPSQWQPDRTAAAERLLRRAQAAMRGLASLRLDESLTSGLGPGVDSRYRFVAPDRMAYRTSSGTTLIAIGKVSYDSIEGRPFEKGAFGGTDGFRLPALFRWTVYGRTVRWLEAGRRYARLALFDPGTPVWFRLTVERQAKRVALERMVTGGHFMTRRYFGFDRPLRIVPPPGVGR
jgi:copper transport protein